MAVALHQRAGAFQHREGRPFPVAPRRWGERINPSELRAIADAAEKYNAPTVKVTGGQRIGLPGVKKADPPAIRRI